MSKPKIKVQVIGAKALILRGKDARSGTQQPEVFCIMEFGKEKFATAPKPTQKSVIWNENAEFNLNLPDDKNRYLILKVLQKNSSVLSLEEDLFIGQVAVCLKEFVENWDPNDHVKKNNHPLTSKHGKTNKDRGFLEFKISFSNFGKQVDPSNVSKLGVASNRNSTLGSISGNSTASATQNNNNHNNSLAPTSASASQNTNRFSNGSLSSNKSNNNNQTGGLGLNKTKSAFDSTDYSNSSKHTTDSGISSKNNTDFNSDLSNNTNTFARNNTLSARTKSATSGRFRDIDRGNNNLSSTQSGNDNHNNLNSHEEINYRHTIMEVSPTNRGRNVTNPGDNLNNNNNLHRRASITTPETTPKISITGSSNENKSATLPPNLSPNLLQKSKVKQRWRGSFRNLKNAITGKEKSRDYGSNQNLYTLSTDSGFQNSNKYSSQASINSSKSGTSDNNQVNPSPHAKKDPPKTLSILSRQDSTASFDSSNRGHSQNQLNNPSLYSDRNSHTNRSKAGSSQRSGGPVGRTLSIRKKISMNDVDQNLSDDDSKSRNSSHADMMSTTMSNNRLNVTTGNSRENTPSPRMGSKFRDLNRSGDQHNRSSDYVKDYSMREIGGGTYDQDDDPRNMSRDQLMDMVQRQKDELDYKDAQVKHLEEYVDTLLVKIISCNPEILNSEFSPSHGDAHNKLEEKHSIDMQRRNGSMEVAGKGGAMNRTKKTFRR